MKDFFDWKKSGYPPKKFQRIEDIWWSFYIEHIANPATLVKKEATHEDETTILSKTVDQFGSNGGVQSVIYSPPVARSGTEVHQVWWRV
jgi:hypothetical protein